MKRTNPVWVALGLLAVSGAVLGWMVHRMSLRPVSAARPAVSKKASPQAGSATASVATTVGQENRIPPATQQDSSYLYISMSGTGEMLIQDPQARSLGFDPGSHKLIQQIPNGSYDEGDLIDDDDAADAPPEGQPVYRPAPPPPNTLSGLTDNGLRRVEVGRPMPGKYLVKVIARDATAYSLSADYYNRSGDLSRAVFNKVGASIGDGHIYKIEIPFDTIGEIKARRQ